jgi:hypothetical protein
LVLERGGLIEWDFESIYFTLLSLFVVCFSVGTGRIGIWYSRMSLVYKFTDDDATDDDRQIGGEGTITTEPSEHGKVVFDYLQEDFRRVILFVVAGYL